MSEEQTQRQLRGFFSPQRDPTQQAALRNVTRTVVGSRTWSRQPVIANNEWATLGAMPETATQCRDWLNLLEAQRERLALELVSGAPVGYRKGRWQVSRQIQVRNIKRRRTELNLWLMGQAQITDDAGQVVTVQVRDVGPLGGSPTPKARAVPSLVRTVAVAAQLGGEVTDRALLFAVYEVTQRLLRTIVPEGGAASPELLSDADKKILGYVSKLIKLHERGESV